MDVEHSVQTTNNATACGVVDFAVQLRDPKQFNLKFGSHFVLDGREYSQAKKINLATSLERYRATWPQQP
jgi:hypothetical protein